MKKIGVLGSGIVGRTLAAGFLQHGYQVMVGTRNVSKLKEWNEREGEGALLRTFSETANFGDILVLAVLGKVAMEALQLADAENLYNKTIIDATNPISDEPPVNGVLHYFTDLNDSLMEQLQKTYPEANFVKCFSCVGNAHMVNPSFKTKPTMFICGNSQDSKHEVKLILDQFGWEMADMGAVEAARAIEPLAMLWCIPGIRENSWSHAFKLLKQ